MDLKEKLEDSYRENYRLLTTDRMLQTFMVCVFALLIAVILWCRFSSGFGDAEEYYHVAERFLSGKFSYSELGTDLPPLTVLLLIPPKLFSYSPEVFCILFSLYGFAFFMLGGHFMLKSCRETGFSERDAYLLLLVTFLCSLSFLTVGTGPFCAAFVIMALWFYHVRSYTVSFVMLALAVMTGFYPVLLFIILLFVLLRSRRLTEARTGILLFFVICIALWFFPTHAFGEIPFITLPDVADRASVLGWLYGLAGYFPSSDALMGSVFGIVSVWSLIYGLQIRRGEMSMRAPALVLFFSLGFAVFMFPVGTPVQYIWVAMLFP
ncbi:MAG: hypothetical protein IIT75_05410, partial [Candidatus Methanomethylophilus sp.]|nr:hypothetical protein [Methanomethylophilus sp.]